MSATTTNSSTVAYEPASLVSRLVARLIDAALLLPAGYFLYELLQGCHEAGWCDEALPDSGLVLNTVSAAIVVWLFYELVLTARWGRTLGKKIMGIRIVRSERSVLPGWEPFVRWYYRSSAGCAAWEQKMKIDKVMVKMREHKTRREAKKAPDRPRVVRTLVRMLVMMVGLLAASTLDEISEATGATGSTGEALLWIARVALFGWPIVLAASALCDREQHRGWHDLIAPTQVVKQ